MKIIQAESYVNAKDSQRLNLVNASDKHYYPEELLNENNIIFIQTIEDFVQMLDFFEDTKPDAVGLDCEWKVSVFNQTLINILNFSHSHVFIFILKPSFDLADTSSENEETDKKNRSSTFQISTREKSFILDMKNLIESLEEPVLNRFGQLILFNETLLKFGN
jgi:hypothetical protein